MEQIIQEWTKWNMWKTAFKQFYFTYFWTNPATFVLFFIAYIFYRLIIKQISTQNMKFSFKKIL